MPDAVAAVLGITQQPGKIDERVGGRGVGGQGAAVGVRQLRARASTPPPIWSKRSWRQSATVRIVATSREGLGVADEQLWLVPSLDVGAGIDSAAVSLFVERARSVASRFSMATRGGGRGGGDLPSPRRDSVGDRVGGLTDGVDDGQLRCVIVSMTGSGCWSARGAGWSATKHCATRWRGPIDLLDDAEKTLLARCSVFAGGFDLEAPAR